MLSRRRGAVARKKTTRRRGLSAGSVPLVGDISLHNPLIGGAVGGWLGSMLKSEIQDTVFGTPDSTNPEDWKNKIQPYAKGIVLAGLGYLAKRYKYPEVSAGIVGYASGLTRDRLITSGILHENGGGNRRLTNYVSNNLLADNEMLYDNNPMLARRRNY